MSSERTPEPTPEPAEDKRLSLPLSEAEDGKADTGTEKIPAPIPSGENATGTAPFLADRPAGAPVGGSPDIPANIPQDIPRDVSEHMAGDMSGGVPAPEKDAGTAKPAGVTENAGVAEDADDEEELPLPASPAPVPAERGEAEVPATAAGGGGGRDLPPAVTHALDAGQPAPPPTEEPMTLMGHLSELRRRLTRVVIMVLVGFIACYGVAEPIYGWLSEPLKAALPAGSKLIYTSPQGAFFVYLKVALVTSIFATSPFTFYQLWAFIAPGLYKEEKQAIAPLAFFSAFFFLAGASFCYFLVFPLAFRFFMGFATDVIVPMISVEEYLSFALKLLIAFGLVFEMPLFAYFLAKLGLLTPEAMRRQRKYAILAIFIVAAILTPPDVFSQCLMAVPMLVLYEVSIHVAVSARKKRDAARAAKAGSSPETPSETSEDAAHDDA